MKVYIKNTQSDLPIQAKQVKLLVQSFLQNHKVFCSQITIHFVTDKKMCAIHGQFFNDPSSTDCMTFPLDHFSEENPNLGDIFVCPAVALDYSKQFNTDHYSEVSLYIVHGLLHILGYDDIEKEDRRIMRTMEKKELTRLSQLNLLLKPL